MKMAYIKTIEYEESEGELKEIYNSLISSRGKLADVHKVQSLNPASIVSHMKLYMDIMFGQSPLKCYQREMMAVVVSAVNQCEYCLRHHSEALLNFWRDETRIHLLVREPDRANLSHEDHALCQFARDLTVNPELSTRQKTESLKALGLSDRAVLDATLVIAYFNFVNRIVLGLGLEIKEEELRGYKY